MIKILYCNANSPQFAILNSQSFPNFDNYNFRKIWTKYHTWEMQM